MNLPIGDVIFPLRYDVVAQAPFVKLYQSRDWESTEMLLAAARSLLLQNHISLVHEHERELVGSEPLLPEDRPAVFERYYRARVEKLAGLCDSLAQGWDYDEDALAFNPFSPGGLTSMGNPVPPGHFLRNGQHRLIVLYGMGKRYLEPGQYSLRPTSQSFGPLETTGIYIKAGLVTEKQFVEFARLRFSIPPEITKIVGLAAWAAYEHMDWLSEYIKIYWR